MKSTILNLHATGVKKEDIAQRIGYAVKDKIKAQKVVDHVTAEAKKRDPKLVRDEAMAAKRRLIERQNMIKQQEKENKRRRQKVKDGL